MYINDKLKVAVTMLLYREKLLTNAQLKRLEGHQYSCENIGLLDPYLQPFWNFLVSKTPLWLAPNLITVSGLIVNIITTLVLVWYSPDAKGEPPQWACLLCALGLFIYQSLDAIDGKQARRTGTSSPLGELFDHGCDSISTVFVALSACIAVRLGQNPSWMFFQCFCAIILFYCAHWQTYVSGTMKFGRVDVTEAQCCIMIIHVISGTLGSSVWTMQIELGVTLEAWYLIVLTTFLCCSVNIYQVFTTIVTGGVGKNGSTVAIEFLPNVHFYHILVGISTAGYVAFFCFFCHCFEVGGAGKNGSTVAVSGLEIRMVVIFGTCLAYAGLAQSKACVIIAGGSGKNGSTVAGTSVLSPIIPLSLAVVPAYIIYKKSESQLYESNTALYIMAFGFVAAKVTNRLVVAHMTRSELDYLDTAFVGPMMLFLNQYFNFFFNEYYVLWACLIWVTLDLLRYSTEICQEICAHLNVMLFRIPYPNIGYSSAKPTKSTAPSPTNGQQDGETIEEPRRSARIANLRGDDRGESAEPLLGLSTES